MRATRGLIVLALLLTLGMLAIACERPDSGQTGSGESSLPDTPIPDSNSATGVKAQGTPEAGQPGMTNGSGTSTEVAPSEKIEIPSAPSGPTPSAKELEDRERGLLEVNPPELEEGCSPCPTATATPR